MPNFAIIRNGVVENIAVADAPLEENWVICDETPAHIGGFFDGIFFSAQSNINHSRQDTILLRLAEIDNMTSKPRTIREISLGNSETIAWASALDAEAGNLRAELVSLK